MGDYCNIDDDKNFNDLPFSYLRDSIKLLAIVKDRKEGFNLSNSDKLLHRRHHSRSMS